MKDRQTWLYLALWLAASAVVIFLAMSRLPAALVDGVYGPAGNDAFYHARRILDAAVGERGFYQFDHTIHVPEGSWLTWPWAYDYLMAQGLKLALLVCPALEPMKFLAYVPVYWASVNTALFIGVARAAGLPLSLSAVGTLAFSLSAMALYLHAPGHIDHHFIELTFVLASVLTGLRFFREDTGRGAAILLGVVLGIAPAFHNSLFILQIPLVLACGVQWLKGHSLDREKAAVFAISLFASCLLFVLPSETFRNLRFEYVTHSWFHLYVAVCSALIVVAFSRARISRQHVLLMGGFGVLLASPLLYELMYGVSFLRGATTGLDEIQEVKNPLELYRQFGSLLDVTQHYSWLIFLAPFLVVAYAWQIVSRVSHQQVFFACAAAGGLVLLLMQFRLHVFGYWALLIGALVLLNETVTRRQLAVASVAALAVVALALRPTMQHQHFKIPPAGLSEYYGLALPVLRTLANECEQYPGVVLAYSEDGHPIRYHTDCSVIANNFLLTPLHGRKLLESQRLIDMTPEELLQTDTKVDYILVRMYGIFDDVPEGEEFAVPEEFVEFNSTLFIELARREELPEQFEVLGEVWGNADNAVPITRLIRLRRSET